MVDDHFVGLVSVHGAVAMAVAPGIVVFTENVVAMGVRVGVYLQNGKEGLALHGVGDFQAGGIEQEWGRCR